MQENRIFYSYFVTKFHLVTFCFITTKINISVFEKSSGSHFLINKYTFLVGFFFFNVIIHFLETCIFTLREIEHVMY